MRVLRLSSLPQKDPTHLVIQCLRIAVVGVVRRLPFASVLLVAAPVRKEHSDVAKIAGQLCLRVQR